MARTHPVHDTIAALTRTQRATIHITPTIAYRVTAPCLLEQLAVELGASNTGSGGRTIPSSRLLVATDAWDLWQDIQTSVHTWAAELELDRRPYRPQPTPSRPAAGPRPHRPAPWWMLLDPDAADLVDPTRLPVPARPAAARREQVAAPRPQVPPVGRLLRLVAATAVGRGLDQIADAIWRSAERWRAGIEAMLHHQLEQRGVRGVDCPSCYATTVLDQRDDGDFRMPAIVLVQREIAGEPLTWLTCQACGWSRGAGDLVTAGRNAWLTAVADCWRLWWHLRPVRRHRRDECRSCRKEKIPA